MISKYTSIAQYFGKEQENVEIVQKEFSGVEGTPAMFLVKKWNIPNEKAFYGAWNPNDLPSFSLNNGNSTSGADVEGISGQGGEPDRAYFENHAVIKQGNKIFDPSYGSDVVTNQNVWENK